MNDLALFGLRKPISESEPNFAGHGHLGMVRVQMMRVL